jgi:S1-C subfamily serine protease
MNMHDDWQDGPQPVSRRQRFVIPLLFIALAAVLGAGVSLVLGANGSDPAAQQLKTQTQPAAMNDQAVYNRVEPSVVDVTSTLQYDDETAEGTGFVINARDGLVLTNNHVIRDATQVTATVVSTDKTYTARIVGDDPADDVALLQIKGAAHLTAVSLGNSSQVALGAPVLAIGNQAGQGGAPTIAPGIINNTGRTIEAGDSSADFTEVLHGMLQTTAQIQPGDSGGPLADADGQVIGMDTAASSDGSSGVIGFAIPINTAIAIASQIAAGHASSAISIGVPGFLGVLVPETSNSDPLRQEASASRTSTGSSEPLGCATSTGQAVAPATVAPARSGALVEGVLCGTAADFAGLSPGDVVLRVDGQTVTSPDSLTAIMDTLRPGAVVPVTWMSTDGLTRTASLRLDAAPAR